MTTEVGCYRVGDCSLPRLIIAQQQSLVSLPGSATARRWFCLSSSLVDLGNCMGIGVSVSFIRPSSKAFSYIDQSTIRREFGATKKAGTQARSTVAPISGNPCAPLPRSVTIGSPRL